MGIFLRLEEVNKSQVSLTTETFGKECVSEFFTIFADYTEQNSCKIWTDFSHAHEIQQYIDRSNEIIRIHRTKKITFDFLNPINSHLQHLWIIK
jgi:hypothetical protein